MPNDKENWKENLKIRDERTLIMQCDCRDMAHIVEFEITNDGGFGCAEGTVQVFLNRQPSFWKRLVIGFEYIFNFKKLTGRAGWYEIDGTILNEQSLIKMRDFITEKLNSNGSL